MNLNLINASYSARPKRGMVVRATIELPARSKLFKLGSRRVNGFQYDDSQVLATAWWIGEADYTMMVQNARRSANRWLRWRSGTWR